MSTLKTGNITHPSSTGTAITLDASDNVTINGPTNFNSNAVSGIASINGGQIGGSRNLVINGAMTVQQRGTQTNQTGGYTACDRWQFAENGSSVITTTQDTNVPVGKGFGSSLKIEVTNASGTPTAANYALLRTKFEGQNLQQLAKGTSEAKDLTLSFWVSSPKTGTHIVELFDNDNSRQVSRAYTISTANTWQYVSVVYPADTTGSFNNANSASLQLAFWLMAGSDNSSGTLAENWQAYNAPDRAVGQVNVMDSTSNNFYLTGVQLEVGSQATPFEHRLYADELQRCLRYYQVSGTIKGYPMVRYENTGNGKAYSNWRLVPEMRTSPSVSFSGTFITSTGYSGTPTAGDITARQFRLLSASSVNPNDNLWVETNSVTESQGIISDAEL